MILIVGGYVLYLTASYSRIEDNLALEVENSGALSAVPEKGTVYTIVTQNLGFGAYTPDLNGGEGVDFGWAQPFPEDLLPEGISRAIDYDDGAKPTCRNCDIPYEEGNFVIIVDGFPVSANVEVTSVRNVQTGFAYSDHNPVVMQFVLK